MTFHAIACHYARLGFYPFPIVPVARRPYCAKGEHAASRDAGVLEYWGRRYPDADVALAPALSGHFVVDVDPRHEGDVTLAGLPPLPHTVTALTGGAGFHFWFQKSIELADIRVAGLRVDGVTKSGIDLKGLQTGYVVVPPSRHPSGCRYHWEISSRIDEVPVAPPPIWLVKSVLAQSGRCNRYPQLRDPVDPESFLLGRLFKLKGWLGPQIKPGCFAVRCPTERYHSQGTPFDTSTVVFAPPLGSWNDRGMFYCSHSSFCTEEWR